MGFTIYGGELRVPGISLSIEGSLPVSQEVVEQNIAHASGLGLPNYRDTKASSTHLAVVGGGPSIKRNVEELKNWDGDIWAINGAWGWLKHTVGRDSTFISCDPHPIVADWAQGVTKALLETRCAPEAFSALKDAEVTTFDVGAGEGQIRCGSMTVTATPHLACRMGYHSVTLFGCESSFPVGSSHAYMDEKLPEELLVLCGEDSYYLTRPDLYMQAVELAKYFKEVPGFLKEESGGLLRAMLNHDNHYVVWVSDAMVKTMTKISHPEPVIA